MRKSIARSANLRLLTWLSLPYGHTAARYSNGNYSAYNGRAKRELIAIGRQAAHVHVRVLDFAALVKHPGLFRAGVLARRDDNTHFQCIARGSFFYPSPHNKTPCELGHYHQRAGDPPYNECMQYYTGNATVVDDEGDTDPAAMVIEPLTYVTPVDDEAFLIDQFVHNRSNICR